jgi:rhodanese-related sulfurtransferase
VRRSPILTETVRVITTDELKAKLDRGDRFRLINALGDWEFRAKHIPGSEHFASIDEAVASVNPDEEVVVYCSNPVCRASKDMYFELVQRGYGDVRRFEGGLLAWEDAGYDFEGDAV